MKKAAKSRAKRKAGAARRPRRGRPPGDTSAQTRAAILDAARVRFARVGYERATNRDIAAEAGVTAAAIYSYFDSKPALYQAALEHTLDALAPRLLDVIGRQMGTRASLAELVRETLSAERQNLATVAFLSSVPFEMQRHPEIAKALVARPGSFFNVAVAIVRRGVEGGEIAPDKAERVTFMMMAAFMGLAVYTTTVPGKYAELATQGYVELLEGTLFRG